MRRNYASLDLTALNAATDEDSPEVDLAALDPDAATLLADVLSCDQSEQQAANAVAQLSLDDPGVGCPLEMMDDKTIQGENENHPTSPPSVVPPKNLTLRPMVNDPVRRSKGDFAPSLSPSSKLAVSNGAAMLMRTAAPDCSPLVPVHRNVIQSV